MKSILLLLFMLFFIGCGKKKTVIQNPISDEACRCFVNYPRGYNCHIQDNNLIFYPNKPYDVAYTLQCRR